VMEGRATGYERVLRSLPEVDVPVSVVVPLAVASRAVVFHDEILSQVRHVYEGSDGDLALIRSERDGVRVFAAALGSQVVNRRIAFILWVCCSLFVVVFRS